MLATPASFARTARFGSGGVILRSPSPLSDDQMRAAAPSVFAEDKHTSRSEKYTYIPSADILSGLRAEGFLPFEVRQGGSRIEEKRGFTKHMIRLRRDGARPVGDSFPEIILLNSHDGTSSYQLMSGLFRLVCSNGLIVADGLMQTVRIPHKGDIVHDVIEGAYTVVKNSEALESHVDGFRAVELTQSEQHVFARAAAELRFDDGKNPLEASQLNAPRRHDDQGADLWRTFNRVQENLVRGGIGYIQRDAQGRSRAHRHTRPVNSIDGNVSLNRALWTLATEMQRLKRAA